MTQRTAYACWLHSIPGIGNKTIRKLIEYAGEEKGVYRLKEEQAKRLLTVRQLPMFIKWQREREPERLLEELLQRGVAFRPHFAPDYPKRLKDIPDFPYAVYTMGQPPEAGQPAAAVIGARDCSAYGRYMAEQIGKELSRRGICVISGMARGIDGISQMAAAAAGGATVSVLGCGVDICYPPEHRELYEYCKTKGMLLSEYVPGTRPESGLFPPRNRLISGLSDALIVVEAREKSGTFITVDMALEQGKDVYAVPGRVMDPLSSGCNRLISQGAQIFTSVEELFRSGTVSVQSNAAGQDRTAGIFGEAAGTKHTPQPEQGSCPQSDDALQQALYELCDYYPRSLSELYEQLCREAGWRDTTMGAVCGALMELRLKGAVTEQGKNYYIKTTI